MQLVISALVIPAKLVVLLTSPFVHNLHQDKSNKAL
jgi:hypothetical protein